MSTPNLEKFLGTTEGLRAVCQAVEIAAILLRQDDAWHVVAGRVVLSPWPRPRAFHEAFDVGNVAAVSMTFGADVLPAVVDGLRAQRLFLGGWRGDDPLPLRCANGSEPNDWLNLRAERSEAHPVVGDDWPAHTIVISGQYGRNDSNALSAAQDALVSANPPYLDWADLMRDLGFGVEYRDLSRRGPWICASAIVPARIAEVATSITKLHAEVEVLPSCAAAARVATIQVGAARADRRLLAITPEVQATLGPARTVVPVELPQSGGPVHVVLSYDGWACDRAMGGVPDGRAAVHALFDPEHRELRTRLNPKSDQADRLEEAIVWLLHLLGFATARYGFKWLNNSPDVVAFLAERRVLVCECSWGPVDPDMITKLKHRAAEVEKQLVAVGVEASVVPLAVTASEQRTDDEDPAGPKEQGVALLTQNDLQEWANRATRGEGPEPFWEFVAVRATPLPEWDRQRRTGDGYLPGLGVL